MTEKQLIKTITILSCLSEKKAIPLISGLWKQIEALYFPFPPPLHKGEILAEVRGLSDRGWVTVVDGSWLVSLSYAGRVELQELILKMEEPWSVEKAFLILQVGFFYLAGRVHLDPNVAEFIRDRMDRAIDYKRTAVGEPVPGIFDQKELQYV